MKIELWSDYACPYCYIGEVRLKKAMEETDNKDEIEIIMRSFELDPNASHEVTSTTLERFAKKYGLSKEVAKQRIDAITDTAIEEGIDFRYISTRYTNTFNAHRLTKFAESKGEKGISEKLFKAYFTDNMELSNLEVLKEVAEQVGLDSDEVSKMLETDLFAKEVREDEREAARHGIYGVPYFLINGKYAISGAQPTALIRKALEELLEKEKVELHETMDSMVCGPDGCHIGGEKV